MKNIRYFFAAAAFIGLLASCSEKDFTPATGNTPVELTVADTIPLITEYITIPVQQTAESQTATKAGIEILSCTALNTNGETITLAPDTGIIVTSSEIYVLPASEGESGFEIRIPGFSAYQSIDLSVRLIGDNLGTVTEKTIVAMAPTEIDMTGNWNINGSIFTITMDENGNYTVIDPFTGFGWAAVRDQNTLTISLPSEWPQENVGDPHGVVSIYFIGYPDGKLYLDVASAWDFTSSSTLTLTNGLAIGFVSPVDGYFYNWTGSIIEQGTVGRKQ